jgi:hypothetical protein
MKFVSWHIALFIFRNVLWVFKKNVYSSIIGPSALQVYTGSTLSIILVKSIHLLIFSFFDCDRVRCHQTSDFSECWVYRCVSPHLVTCWFFGVGCLCWIYWELGVKISCYDIIMVDLSHFLSNSVSFVLYMYFLWYWDLNLRPHACWQALYHLNHSASPIYIFFEAVSSDAHKYLELFLVNQTIHHYKVTFINLAQYFFLP